MKDRRRREGISWSTFFWCIIFLVIFTGFSRSTFRLFHDNFQPVLVSRWRSPAMEAVSGTASSVVSVKETVLLPDQVLFFVKYPPSARLFTKEDLHCLYKGASIPALITNGQDRREQIVRCPVDPGQTITLELKSGTRLHSGFTHTWNFLAYEALIDRDNSTIVFVKGLNLKPERNSNPSRFECVYGWDLPSSKFVLRSNALSVAQEIVRCRTPVSVLANRRPSDSSDLKVSVRWKGGSGVLPSIARPTTRIRPGGMKRFEVCSCTMVRNQAQFVKEWVMYHARIGIQRWFIYDNNSEDEIDGVVDSLAGNYNITLHVWPWVKTQEAGFSHCAIRARPDCEWVVFIDVDEFFHLPTGLLLTDVIRNVSGSGRVGEIRTSCHNFGPSGLKQAPAQGVTVGYTCRMGLPERHKSVIKPDALNLSLVNVVHHFHLGDGFKSVHMDRATMVINHYKYQVWDVFKEKFYRRVATYVADWQDEENVGSKDRAPGLGTKPVEPLDWSNRFCEMIDTGLKDRVVGMFLDPDTKMFPWQGRGDLSMRKKSLWF